MNFGCSDIVKKAGRPQTRMGKCLRNCQVSAWSEISGVETSRGLISGIPRGVRMVRNPIGNPVSMQGSNQWHSLPMGVRMVRNPIGNPVSMQTAFFNPNTVAGKALWCI